MRHRYYVKFVLIKWLSRTTPRLVKKWRDSVVLENEAPFTICLIKWLLIKSLRLEENWLDMVALEKEAPAYETETCLDKR